MICESCLAAAADEAEADGFFEDDLDDEIQRLSLAGELGADIPDHYCDEPEACLCGCRLVAAARSRRRR